jgi:hypothetical protein
MTIGMGILWGGLFGAPVAGLLINSFWQGERRTMLISAVAIITLISLTFFIGLRFTWPILNISTLLLAYTAYALLTVDGWGISHKRFILRALATTITALPIVFGYFLATIGFLGLLFLFGDFTGRPGHAETLAPGIGCEIRTQSGGPSWGTTVVSVHSELTPFLRVERVQQRLSEEDAAFQHPSDLCRGAYETWRNG